MMADLSAASSCGRPMVLDVACEEVDLVVVLYRVKLKAECVWLKKLNTGRKLAVFAASNCDCFMDFRNFKATPWTDLEVVSVELMIWEGADPNCIVGRGLDSSVPNRP